VRCSICGSTRTVCTARVVELFSPLSVVGTPTLVWRLQCGNGHEYQPEISWVVTFDSETS
jgi:hypothetical protein